MEEECRPMLNTGLRGVVIADTRISDVQGAAGKLIYRGYLIQDLANTASFEEVAYLLLFEKLPDAAELKTFKAQLAAERDIPPEVIAALKTRPKDALVMDVLQAGVSLLANHDPDVTDQTQEAAVRMAIRLIAKFPTLLAAWDRIRNDKDPLSSSPNLDHAANFLYMLKGEAPDEEEGHFMDTCLVLHAEHTINASTFAAMVSGSTLAMPSYVIAAAIGTLAGPLHGGANEHVIQMLQEIGKPENARAWLNRKLAAKEVIWGMGHREYKVKDPRATLLQKLLKELAASQGSVSPLFETAMALEEACEEHLAPKGVYPNVDFYSGILYREMGIPPDQFTSMFAIARTVGWVAQWLEQSESPTKIGRPRQIYAGPTERDYKPVSERG